MAEVLTVDGFVGAWKQSIIQKKTASITAVANTLFSPFAQAGNPGAGTLAGTDATVGVIPVAGNAGFPAIGTFKTGSWANITGFSVVNSVPGRVTLFDVMLKLGTFAYNAAVSGLTTLDISGRCPLIGAAVNYGANEILIEAVTAFTGNVSVAITYLDGNGNAQTTGTVATGAALIVGRCLSMPLANGTGVRSITGVTCTVATAGTLNVLIARRLIDKRVTAAGATQEGGLTDSCKQIHQQSACAVYVTPDSTATGLPEVYFDISSQ